MNVVLVGMSGSGKTTVSYALGKLSGMQRFDTDEQIEREYGAITNLFEDRGEEFFRDVEADMVARFSQMQSVIISTGGGCLLRQKNAHVLKNSGKIVYLRTSVDELENRLNGDNKRPLLIGNLKSKLSEMLSARDPVYSANADLIVDTDGLTPEEVAKVIWENIK